jgi:iron complex transport system substrate-binding protein
VVALGEEFVLADLLALGVTPVASTATVAEVGFQGMGDADTSGIEILPATEVNLEQLAALDPDLIVTTAFIRDEAGGDLLDALGEVVVIPDGASPDDQLRQLAEAFGRTEAADAVLAELDTARAAARAAVDARSEPCTVSLATVYPGPSVAAWVDGSTDIPAAVLDAGCSLVPSADAGSADRNGRLFLSAEQLGLLAAPRMILLQSSSVDGEDSAVDSLGSDALWQSLPAVADDAVVVLDRLAVRSVRSPWRRTSPRYWPTEPQPTEPQPTGPQPRRRPTPRSDRPAGTTIGVPTTGSGITTQSRPNTSRTRPSVITRLGSPEATIAPSRIAMTWWAYRHAWFRSCNTITTVAPRSSLTSRTRSSTSTWWAMSRKVVGSSSSSNGVCCARVSAIQTR